jgi:hypothetical protein
VKDQKNDFQPPLHMPLSLEIAPDLAISTNRFVVSFPIDGEMTKKPNLEKV